MWRRKNDARLVFWVPSFVKERVQEYAAYEGRSVSNYLRWLLARELEEWEDMREVGERE